jgi:hypothetical protein
MACPPDNLVYLARSENTTPRKCRQCRHSGDHQQPTDFGERGCYRSSSLDKSCEFPREIELFRTERFEWIYLRGAARRQKAGDERDREQ